jgi:hypothetical protein
MCLHFLGSFFEVSTLGRVHTLTFCIFLATSFLSNNTLINYYYWGDLATVIFSSTSHLIIQFPVFLSTSHDQCELDLCILHLYYFSKPYILLWSVISLLLFLAEYCSSKPASTWRTSWIQVNYLYFILSESLK